MYSKSACGFTVAIPLLMTLNLNYVIKRAFAGEHHKCPINNYHDGDYCIECPAGYFGVNCTNICPPLYYGIMCLQKCDCSTCHHVQGCISTTRIPVEILGTTSHKCVSKDEIKDTTKTKELTSKNENRAKIQRRDKTQDSKTNFGWNVVIFVVGSLFSFILILAILREICLCLQLSRPTGLLTTFGDVYTDIAEMEDRRTD
ncbi:uncharacterized protein LOC128160570 [Crassostrea angulata]|uniref:uncharacterized protein LOC128160570 n=1 Tax=Magallana angulata TaxID=2784310 RepID=UPI0022B1B578|nr:uncharacterized protein LOC128160570 [Crassostrea angulata]